FVGARQRLVGAVVTQFVRPHGFAGRLAGWEMALRPSKQKAQPVGGRSAGCATSRPHPGDGLRPWTRDP
ncbi:MAG TPA: hypothetical protein VKA58_03370, partial [Propionibacteriaceae bacterium]|nr:hypothetical protein [Propionibacteriaceae bacterium]